MLHAIVLPKVIKCDSKIALSLPSGIYPTKRHLTGDRDWMGPPEVNWSLGVSHIAPDRCGSTCSWGLPVTKKADSVRPPLQHFDLNEGKMPSNFHTDLFCCCLSLSWAKLLSSPVY